MSDDDLEKLREEKMQELQERDQGGGAQEEAQQRAEAQKKAVLRQSLEPEARERLNALSMAKPDFADQVEKQVVALAQSGRLQGKIDEEQMKQLLKKLQPDDDDYDIKHSGL
ncbi:DNA-binding protein [Haladaptatus sp. F3-133]|jgi:programmed cell death protein 5|uniref:DNA-binding protein EGH25_07525 n=1 Tax=Halorutilus salinus TaxID=2487751 RepID=A0A9Q4GJG6_9EURY|nr:DNA-binding protein [Halorutilus salinus]MCX2819201.1 DNA-binding protein [Halorutilus salinus]